MRAPEQGSIRQGGFRRMVSRALMRCVRAPLSRLGLYRGHGRRGPGMTNAADPEARWRGPARWATGMASVTLACSVLVLLLGGAPSQAGSAHRYFSAAVTHLVPSDLANVGHVKSRLLQAAAAVVTGTTTQAKTRSTNTISAAMLERRSTLRNSSVSTIPALARAEACRVSSRLPVGLGTSPRYRVGFVRSGWLLQWHALLLE